MKTKRNPSLHAALALLVIAAFAASFARAAVQESIAVTNFDFSAPAQADGGINTGAVTGWAESGGTIGNFNPNDGFYIGTTGAPGTIGTMSDPHALFFFNAAGQSVSQTTGTTLAPGVRYTLTAAVGERSSAAAAFGGYNVQLLSGASVLESAASGTVPALDTFADVSVEYVSGSSSPAGSIGIRLGQLNDVGGNDYVDYDNVRLTAEVARPIAGATYVYDGTGQGSQPSSSPDPVWPDTGGVELTNGQLPASVAFTDPQWVGFVDDAPDDTTSHPQITFDLQEVYEIEVAQIAYLHSNSQAGGTITAPEEVLVSISDDGSTFGPATSYTAEFDSSAGNEIRFAYLDLTAFDDTRYVRFDFRNTGQWTFLSEITIGTVPTPAALPAGLAMFGFIAARRRRS